MKSAHTRPSNVKKRILSEAVRLFAENGYEGTSVQAVAEAVGIKNPSLLYYFKSKEQLREAVLDDMLSHWKDELPRLISQSTTSQDRFGSLVESVVGFFAEDKNRARLTIREMLDNPTYIGAQIKTHLGPWIQLISDYINMGKKSGIIRPEIDPERYIFQIILIVAGTLALSDVTTQILGETDDSTRGPAEGIVRAARDILFVNSYRTYLERENGKSQQRPGKRKAASG
ncbi:MAG: TetR/AcrR family transcriptional regulator [Deltaproteobacteria bacterium]|nr:TetR/AcrR family transcriptional regulator [Deltaproteobacteria bacterium]